MTGTNQLMLANSASAKTSARNSGRIRIVVVDEKGIMRDGLCALLAVMPDIEISGCVSAGADTARSVASLRPTVILVDFPPLPLKGPKLIAALKAHAPEAGVVMLSFRREGRLIEAALRAGADGYVLKTDRRDDLFEAVLSVATGKRFLSPSIRGHLIRDDGPKPGNERTQAPTILDLTDRERQVIRMIAAGRRTREIAQTLSLSHKTIEKHRASLMRKLGLRNASAVAAYAIAHGLAEE